jgi:glycosyltransferase involved in cell wall biosynthesis
MASLRVGLDGLAYRAPAGGVRRYAVELSRALVALNAGLDVVALGADEAWVPPGVRAIPTRWHPKTNLLWQTVAIPRLARRAAVDVLHAPAYTAPLAGVRRVVLTIHDVSYARRPTFYPYRRDPARRLFYRLSAARADALITVSRFSRDEIVTAFGIPQDRIRVIPEAPAAGFRPASPFARDGDATAPYVLHVGDLHARRDLPVLMRAVLRVRSIEPRLATLHLVLVGADREQVASRLSAMAADAGAPSAVVHQQELSDDGLLRLYQGASVFAYPSRYEGFGLPLVEAMACGVPVVAADAGATPEVLGNAGILCRPGDEGAFAEAIAMVLTHTSRAMSLRRASLIRAAKFSWERAARETLEVYRQCLT